MTEERIELEPLQPVPAAEVPRDLAALIGEAAAARVIALRRDLHRHPEIGMETVRTAARVEEGLRALGVEDVRRFAKTGVAGVIRGAKPGPMIGLRADMDALPIPEETGAPYASECPGKAHLCGHDGHVAGLFAAAEWLLAHRGEFSGSVCLIFQPGEEGFSGAAHMIEDGLFDAFPCREVFAIHGEPGLPLGQIKVRAGAMTASADLAYYTVEGKGGHGARPHQTIDPVPAAAELILAMQTIVSRNVDPTDSAVLSMCWVSAGDVNATTVIPQRVRLSSVARAFDPAVRDLIEKRVHEICEGIGLATGTKITVDYNRLYPPQINDAALFEAVRPALERELGAESVVTNFKPVMISEDFAFMSEKVPGVYIQLGLDGEAPSPALHSPRFNFSESALGVWTRVMAAIVKDRLPAAA